MKALPPFSALRRNIQTTSGEFFSQRIFSDRLSVTLLIGAGVVNALTLLSLALNLHPSGSMEPVRFSSLGLNQYGGLGPWYYPFQIALFAVVVTIANGVFALMSFGRSRIGSFFLLTGSVVVAIFCFIISMAFGAIR